LAQLLNEDLILLGCLAVAEPAPEDTQHRRPSAGLAGASDGRYSRGMGVSGRLWKMRS
jgi:hypothetical protein